MIDVVIVNWNSGDALRACLHSLDAEHQSFIQTIVVVDNASTDGSQTCTMNTSKTRLLQSAENLGFAKACNWGALEGDSEWILFLNPDTRVAENTLDIVASRLESMNANIGVFGVQLQDENSRIARTCARIPTPSTFIIHAIGFDRLLPRLGFPMLEWDHRETRFVDHVMGSFYLIRRPLFIQLHGFDERFFLYLEDLDLSKRCFEAGYKIQYWSDVAIFHEGGGCSKQIKAQRLFYDLRSRWVYAQIHFTKSARLIYGIATLLLEPLTRLVGAVASLSMCTIVQIWGAYRLFLSWLLGIK